MKTTLLSATVLAAMATLSLAKAPAPKVLLTADLAHPHLPADKKMTTYLKVGLTGFELEPDAKRAPVNVSIVIDKSSSMHGEKIIHAREAAKQALDRLGNGDIVSIIAYDDAVHVISPAAPLESREKVRAAIDSITPSGTTALFAGVSKAAEELRKFKTANQVNRIVLLSDGMANVGPSSPQELGRLGTSLAKEGITVSTLGLGLGYNEDLMIEIAIRSDGNHAFVHDTEKLAAVFQQEFGDILSVVAQQVQVRIVCAEGVRPVRVLGREADIRGQEITLDMNQLYSKQHKYVLVEVEVPAGKADTDATVAEVELTALNMVSNSKESSSTKALARRVNDAAIITASINKEVMIEVAKSISIEKEEMAVKLNDEGKHAEAMTAYADAAKWTAEQGKAWDAPELQKISEGQTTRYEMFNEGGKNLNIARKNSRAESWKSRTQNAKE